MSVHRGGQNGDMSSHGFSVEIHLIFFFILKKMNFSRLRTFSFHPATHWVFENPFKWMPLDNYTHAECLRVLTFLFSNNIYRPKSQSRFPVHFQYRCLVGGEGDFDIKKHTYTSDNVFTAYIRDLDVRKPLYFFHNNTCRYLYYFIMKQYYWIYIISVHYITAQCHLEFSAHCFPNNIW